MISRIGSRAILCAVTLLALFSASATVLQAQETGAVTGVVMDAMSGQPAVGAQVTIQGTQLMAVANQQGRYQIVNVPAGTHSLRVELMGYSSVTRQITVAAGQTVTANISANPSAVALQELVVTGVSGGAMERGKVPFTVARVDLEQMPVPAVNMLSQIQGKVPGANIASVSGRPGTAPEIILRGPTSINAMGRSQGPLIIVDGIVLGSDLADINPSDIESVEIVKGAAASTLFGSRAASGVISITTRRGSIDGVRFTARSEVGFNDIEGDFGIARNHTFMMNETGTRFCVLDDLGTTNFCSRTLDWDTERQRVNHNPEPSSLAAPSFPIDPGAVTPVNHLRRSFLAGNWVGNTYNAVDQLVEPKPILQNDFSMSGRVGSSNFFASVGQTRQEGAIMGLDGYERYNARLNLGHRIGTEWNFDITSYVSRASDDGSAQEEGSAGFFRLTRQPAIVDMTARDQFGRLYIRSSLFNGGTQNFNPLYWFENDVRTDVRWRYMMGGTIGYTPFHWLQSDANVSVDRFSNTFTQFRNKGFRTTTPAIATNEGLLFNGVSNQQSLNSGVGVTLLPTFSDIVNTRITMRWLYETQRNDSRSLQGNRLRVRDITNAANATNLQFINSNTNETRQMGLSAGAFIDLLDRYTFDFAVRRDGSSRFGVDHRWQTYGRASAAWLMAREEWFPSDVLSTFTLRASYGTAGNTPNFAAQYETFNLGAGGTLTAATLGNPNLRPEVVKETEVGVDMELLNRYGLTLTYANSLATDQIMPVPVSIATGFPQQWQNAGDLRNQTWEAALTVPVIQRTGLTWTTRANYMQNQPMVENLGRPPFFIGTNLQASQIIQIKEGERYGTLYGRKFATSCGELPAHLQAQCGGPTSAFQRNDEGWMVWVGEGNNPSMGITHNLWNAVLPAADGICPAGGVEMSWGMPILIRDQETCSPAQVALGHALPDHRVGLANTIQYGRASLYGLVEGAFGQSVWNQGRHWSLLDFLGGEIDQGGKSIETAKPIGYYYRAGPGTGGGSGVGGFYDILAPNNRTVEDASFIKLREVSASYNLGQLSNLGEWTVSLVGRNLLTFTDYRGFDPEVGAGNSGGEAGSGLINAIDAFTFPQLRTFSLILQASF